MPTTICIADLLEMSSWKLALLAGRSGLERTVSWAHVYDVADVGGWVDGGELVIVTGAHLAEDPDEQVEFLTRLQERGAAGLAIGFRGPDLSDLMLQKADDLGFPIMRVPRETAHIAIVKFVAAANNGEIQKELVTAIRIFETITPREDEIESSHRFRQIENISGYELFLTDDDGRALLPGFRNLPEGLLEHVRRTVPTSSRWSSLAIPRGYARPINVSGRRAGFLVAQGSGRAAAGFSVFGHIETIARLELTALYADREVRRREGAELFGQYMHGEHPVQLSSDLEGGWGTNFEDGLSVASVRIDPSQPVAQQVDREIQHRLSDQGIVHLLLTENDRTLVALPSHSVTILHTIASTLPVRIGVSASRASLIDAAVARREAIWAERHGRRDPVSGVGYFVSEEEWGQWLPSAPSALAQLVKNTLGPILDYDESKDADLMESLQVYFSHEGRLQVAADQLFVHKHTLAYRLRRIEQLTGRDLSSMRDRAQLWLALSALESVAGGVSETSRRKS
ncbi:PucR family transcriptional regulator [Arthrobacter sp. 2MCAF15]|uniref:PucR family transcriptional regulator n=1 Tax=Arthrobacter sp. 2MCAF15 TaxID=3232984 RepID=UPI003F930937